MPKPISSGSAKTLGQKVRETLGVILSSWAIVLGLKFLFIGTYQIPSQSMMPSLFVGDTLLTENVTWGNWFPLLHLSVPGFAKPARNDIAAFVSPEWKSPGFLPELVSVLTLGVVGLDNTPEHPKYLVKRVIGEPGDRVRMIQTRLFVNGNPVSTKAVGSVTQPFKKGAKTASYQEFTLFEEKYGKETRLVQHLPSSLRVGVPEVYDFDEVSVPRKGIAVDLTNRTPFQTLLMKYLVERESRKPVEIVGGRWYHDGKEIFRWKPKEDYYFMMGDNRDFSYDSRYLGFVPESLVFGRPLVRYLPVLRAGIFLNENPKTALKRNYGK